jgi:hypothetical protein
MQIDQPPRDPILPKEAGKSVNAESSHSISTLQKSRARRKSRLSCLPQSGCTLQRGVLCIDFWTGLRTAIHAGNSCAEQRSARFTAVDGLSKEQDVPLIPLDQLGTH